MQPRISMIVAVANNLVIGSGNELAWHIRDDLRRFRMMTEGKTIIVGRLTFEQLKNAYESRGKPLPDRKQIILTKNTEYQVGLPKCYVCHSLEEALVKAKEIESDEVFVAGGAAIFAQALPFVSRIYMTKVELEVEGDAFFPKYSDFSKVLSEESKEENGIKFRYLILERV
ncbi:hypothetical protein DCC61_00645 [Candidatus Microgenomates bacterium]|nr:dihydrofolate reductase [Candidatus Microgenomates bacterium CPR3]RIK52064.1 MAG: hypothetical protein DCC61_00645 [Candidatus Microgenomates bacterium]